MTETPLGDVTGKLTQEAGEQRYRIDGVERMEPFLMSIVSDSDLWMWVSSTGALTAGRVDADRALFPYLTDDALHRLAGVAGPVTIVARHAEGRRELWQPFGAIPAEGATRSIRKHTLGNRIVLEEEHRGWGLRFRATWSPSNRYGWVRESRIINTNRARVRLEVLDGLADVMPMGISATMEQTLSNLANAYKRSETGAWKGVAIYSLEARITDRAEPAEALAATMVWSVGGEFGRLTLDEREIGRMRRGEKGARDGGETADGAADDGSLVVGRPGAYLLRGEVRLEGIGDEERARLEEARVDERERRVDEHRADERLTDERLTNERAWMMIGDVNLSHAAIADRAKEAQAPGVAARVRADIEASSKRLAALLTAADGFQRTGDAVADAHHLSNVLFNCMRGGVFPHAYRIPIDDLQGALGRRNRGCWERYRGALAALGEKAGGLQEGGSREGDLGEKAGGSGGARWVNHDDLLRWALDQHDPDAVRLVLEYLPLTFSRRHGDPSRPWNKFSIETRNPDGSEILSYQGNWRDIFQNWEALLYSFPRFIPNVVAKFVNTTTRDGYNPYRIVRDGFDCEEPNPNNPWANIGYWGDHQIVYLLRLLETWEHFDPDGVMSWLERRVFGFADVPYTIAAYGDMVRNPRATVTYDWEGAARIDERVARRGGDGRLVVGADGAVLHVSLLEKLLIPALAKIGALVPHGGIWMNTQRPEWNDANNALAGFGLSMVTLFYLRRYIKFVDRLLERMNGDRSSAVIGISVAVADWMGRQVATLERFIGLADAAAVDPQERKSFLDDMGASGDAYRREMRAGFEAPPQQVAIERARRWCELCARHLDGSIRAARRTDGLFHSYNLIHFRVGESDGASDGAAGGAATVSHLEAMLEGQVAALSSGILDAREGAEMVEALFASELYRADQDSFILYPARMPRAFHARNRIAAERLGGIAVLRGAEATLGAVFERDSAGEAHFRAHLTNAAALERTLAETGADAAQKAAVLALYEEVFNHHAYSGRSGSMHGYEGIGSIYWHMVGKLQVATQELYWQARQEARAAGDGNAAEGDGDTIERVAEGYRRIRGGLGFHKSPALFGAIPTDCYSHTPAHAGAQQPGMTGQVKEGILARISEIGLRVSGGTLSVALGLLSRRELFGDARTLRLSLCATPIEIGWVERSDEERVAIEWSDGRESARAGTALTPAESEELFGRSGKIKRIRVYAHSPR